MSTWLFWSIIVLLVVIGASMLLSRRYRSLYLFGHFAGFCFYLLLFVVSAARGYWVGVVLCAALLAWMVVSFARDRQKALECGVEWPQRQEDISVFLTNLRSPTRRNWLVLGLIVGLVVPLLLAAIVFS